MATIAPQAASDLPRASRDSDVLRDSTIGDAPAAGDSLAAGDAAFVAGSEAASAADGGGDVRRTTSVTPEEIFALVNTDADDVLDRDEFTRMFQILDLELSEAQQEQLFALCDVDCTGTITEEEFVAGWALMVDNFLDEGAEQVGLGRMRIIGIVLYILFALGMVIAFQRVGRLLVL